MKRYLFIDRDGTIIAEPADEQIDSFEKFKLLPGVISALQRLSNGGFHLVMVSNQDGLGTSNYPQEKFDAIQTLLMQILSSQGIHFEEVLLCPHKAAEGCKCRKPQTLLVQKYLRTNEMDRSASFVIGDRNTDLQLAENMGLQALRVSESNSWVEIVHQILDQPRSAKVLRKTNETNIEVEVNLDRESPIEVKTNIGFFDHMLDQLARHGGFSLRILAKGDLHIDEHHLVEDVAITLGKCPKAGFRGKTGNRPLWILVAHG